ncbi:glycosyltransferase family 2 protein [uncultured Acetatifactor sp.]|uniref:glycosyltransferase family 2 protein n=1 Tax=uncultured Acetatifactor sp. TaxID=1671927 RepID=UPI002603BD2F|nr:glycosyltransferase family 2 protein [uncultured Acetatifactor sp.]
MENPLISVIIPIYNVEKYLPTCMESIFSQTYRKLEIILVDDGSKDNCSRLCDEYAEKDDRVKIYHKENGGLSDARNYGVERANGEYITYVDSDDYVDSDYIEYLYLLIRKYNSQIALCQHRVHYNNGFIKEIGKTGDEELTVSRCLERMLYHDVIDTSAWAKLYHRDLFHGVCYPVNKIFEDTATTYILMMKCEKIAIGYESKYNYIFRNNSIINSEFNRNKLDLIEITDKMALDIIQKYPDLKKAVLRRQIYARFSTLNQMLGISGYSDIRDELIRYIKMHKKDIICNHKTPKKDKIGLILLLLSYRLYRFCWLRYRYYIMEETP